MKKSIAWHEECLKNQGYSLKRLEEECARTQKELEKARREFQFYAQQIAIATQQGKTGFDQDRFLVKRRSSFETIEPQQSAKPEWVVNSLGELGVKVNGRYYFLYKGQSLEYTALEPHDDETPLMVRLVGKREFGETCQPRALLEMAWRGVPVPDHYRVEVKKSLGPEYGDGRDYSWQVLPWGYNYESQILL